jgi:hypothetical protein
MRNVGIAPASGLHRTSRRAGAAVDIAVPGQAPWYCAARLQIPRQPAMTRDNILYLIVGALTVVMVALAYQLYEDHRLPPGVHFEIGPNGALLEKK